MVWLSLLPTALTDAFLPNCHFHPLSDTHWAGNYFSMKIPSDSITINCHLSLRLIQTLGLKLKSKGGACVQVRKACRINDFCMTGLASDFWGCFQNGTLSEISRSDLGLSHPDTQRWVLGCQCCALSLGQGDLAGGPGSSLLCPCLCGF